MLTYTTTYPSEATLRLDPDCPNGVWTECDCGRMMSGYRKACDCQSPLWCEHFLIVCPNEGRGDRKNDACIACEKYAHTEWPRPGFAWRRLN